MASSSWALRSATMMLSRTGRPASRAACRPSMKWVKAPRLRVRRILWALVLARPRILADDPGLRAATGTRVEQLLDSDNLNPLARSELTGVAYAVRLAQR